MLAFPRNSGEIWESGIGLITVTPFGTNKELKLLNCIIEMKAKKKIKREKGKWGFRERNRESV